MDSRDSRESNLPTDRDRALGGLNKAIERLAVALKPENRKEFEEALRSALGPKADELTANIVQLAESISVAGLVHAGGPTKDEGPKLELETQPPDKQEREAEELMQEYDTYDRSVVAKEALRAPMPPTLAQLKTDLTGSSGFGRILRSRLPVAAAMTLMTFVDD